MAASTLTFTAGQWKYVDGVGMEHTVTTSQTLSMTVVDNGVADVHYSFATGQSVTLTDGRKLEIRARADMATNGTGNGNGNRTIAPLTDAGQGTAFYGLRGEFHMVCPESGCLQIWKVAQMTPSDADFGSAGTITMVLEDQFGHVMSIPFQLSGTVSVGQAAQFKWIRFKSPSQQKPPMAIIPMLCGLPNRSMQ